MALEPVRLLMVLTVRFAQNGIANSVLNYVSRLDPARVRCDLVSPNNPEAGARAAFERTGGRVFVLGGRNRNPVSYIRKLSRITRARQIEIVHAHGNSATLYVEMRAASLGGANVRIPHSHNTTCKMKVADRLLRRTFYKSYTNAFACSQAAGEWLFPNLPFEVLNNAVDTERFGYSERTRGETRAALEIRADSFTVCHVGAFNEQKNQAFLLCAFAELLQTKPDAVLLLIGGGELLSFCRARAKSLGIESRVRFLGWRDDVPALLAAADAFALPSLHEGLPLSLVEAQCAGLWCLASDRVTKESALTPHVAFCPIEDARAFAQALLDAPKLNRAKESKIAIASVKAAGFDAKMNAEQLMQRYELLAGRAWDQED